MKKSKNVQEFVADEQFTLESQQMSLDKNASRSAHRDPSYAWVKMTKNMRKKDIDCRQCDQKKIAKCL